MNQVHLTTLTLGFTIQNLVLRLHCTLGASPQRKAHADNRVESIDQCKSMSMKTKA